MKNICTEIKYTERIVPADNGSLFFQHKFDND